MMHRSDDFDDLPDPGPSRSQRRREALAVFDLGEQLVALPASRLAAIALPDDVRAEIANVRRIDAHVARKRQLGFLAKLMRRHDDEVFAAARAALGNDRARQHREAAGLHRLEALRERLLAEGDRALEPLLDAHPQADRQHLRALIRQARSERARQAPGHACRALFRALRELDGAEADTGTADADGASRADAAD